MNKFNTQKLNNLEILSPAGNPECFYADINAGADAVYLGLSSFNARMKAENFTTENIREYVKKAHFHGVKVYVTLNTLLTDDNFDDLIELVKVLVDAKVDAYIIQDLGVAYILKKTFDDIELHASTQLGIHNLAGALVAEKLGFSRIVLSREAKLEDIKQIRDNTNLEIEYFIQGALCVAFSGNCYLSSLEKGQSGNEGKCLQLCRLPYENSLTNETAYYLSARDLSLLSNMEKLIDAGVMSFKIEGRMRHAGYCATVTNIYKTAIEKIKCDEFTKEWIDSQSSLLRQTFSRGDFNKNAYLEDKTPDSIIYKDYQNHIGVEIGKVLSVNPFKSNLYIVRVQSTHKLSCGDGIKIIDKKSKSQVASLGIGDVKNIQNDIYEFVTKYKFRDGLSVFLTQNAESEKNFLSKIRKVNVDFKIIANSEQKMLVTATINGKNYKFESDFILQKALKSPISKEEIISQFSKVSETDFNPNNFKIETDGVFIPKSVFNAFRRDIFEQLSIQIIDDLEKNNNAKYNQESYKKTIETANFKNLKPLNIAIIDENFADFDKLSNFDKIVFNPSIYSKKLISDYYNKLKDKFALNLPTILNYNDYKIIDEIIKSLPEKITLYINNIYGLIFADTHNIIASPLLNVKNKMAINSLYEQNILAICSSVETEHDYADKNNLIHFSGNFPLMTFAHCPFKTIYSTNCESCKFNDKLKYINTTLGSYKITRKKIFNCYFELNGSILKKNSKFFAINFNK